LDDCHDSVDHLDGRQLRSSINKTSPSYKFDFNLRCPIDLVFTMFSILLSTICLPPPLGDQACRPRLSYDGQSHYCMLLPKKLQNKGPLLRDMPYVTAFGITFSNRGLGVPNSCCLCLGLAMHGIEVLTSDVRMMGWPLPPSAYLPDHLSVNTLHTYRTDHRHLAIMREDRPKATCQEITGWVAIANC
jgi:hypothetical protein